MQVVGARGVDARSGPSAVLGRSRVMMLSATRRAIRLRSEPRHPCRHPRRGSGWTGAPPSAGARDDGQRRRGPAGTAPARGDSLTPAGRSSARGLNWRRYRTQLPAGESLHQMLTTSSDSFAVVSFGRPRGRRRGALTRGGYEIVDKFARKGNLAIGRPGGKPSRGVQALVETDPSEGRPRCLHRRFAACSPTTAGAALIPPPISGVFPPPHEPVRGPCPGDGGRQDQADLLR